MSTRNVAIFRDPAVILIDQLKEIYIDGELETIETANWFPKVPQGLHVGLNLTGSGVDDPDQQFYENYACGSQRNYTGYCNPELDKKFDQQSMETDQEKRKRLVWEIDSKLAGGRGRPIIYHLRRHLLAATGQGADDDGQQRLQWLALRRRLARRVSRTILVEQWASGPQRDEIFDGSRRQRGSCRNRAGRSGHWPRNRAAS